MKFLVLVLTVSLWSAAAAAQSLAELFHRAKEQVKAGSWQDALRTLEVLDAEAAKPGNEGLRPQLVAPTAFYRGVCEANLGEADKARADFTTFVNAQPNASMDPAMYSKKAVAAFADAKKTTAPQAPADRPSAGSSMFNAFLEFKAPANIGEEPEERWGDGPVKWIMRADEKRAWSQLSSGSERAEFVEKFWEARNPKPGSEDNSVRTTFDRRVAFADSRFVQDEEQRGSLTDRGMVFVLLGPPTWAGRKPLQPGDDAADPDGLSVAGATGRPTKSGKSPVYVPGPVATDSAGNLREVWHYRRELLPKSVPYHQLDIEFITKKGYGVNVLQRESETLKTLDAARLPPSARP